MAVITPDGAEVITSKSEIDRLLIQYAMDELYIQPEDIKKDCTQSQFEYLLSCIYDQLYSHKKLYKPINKMDISSICNLNKDLLYSLLDTYLWLCDKYSKIISLMGYSKLSGVDISTLNTWLYEPSLEGHFIAKKIYLSRENGITNRLLDSKNPIAQVAVANKEYAWDGRIVQAQAEQTKARLTVDKLPELAAGPMNHGQIAQSEKGTGIASNQYIER